jgi:sugar phosphate isomerase/epimerase
VAPADRENPELCKIAEDCGIFLAVEFEPGFVVDSTALLLASFDEIVSPALRVNADIGHIFLQDPDPMRPIAACAGRIVHAHLENMKKGVHNHLVPWEGDMDLPAYIRGAAGQRIRRPGCLRRVSVRLRAVAERSLPVSEAFFKLNGGKSPKTQRRNI